MHNNKSGDEEKGDPKENDKCMGDKDELDKDPEVNTKTSKLDALRGRAKQLVSNKYHLIVVLLCVILFILFLIVLVLAIQLGTYECAVPNDCRTADCLMAASSVIARSDPSENPCDDFWSYSCKNWITSTPIPDNRGSYSVVDQLKEKIYKRIRHSIDIISHDVDPGSYEMKVKTFYDSCRNMQNIERRFPEDLKRAIYDLGGWSLLKDYTQSSQWDRMGVLSDLHSIYGIPVFFQVTVGPDDSNPLRNIIKLIPGGLGLPNRDYYFKPDDDVHIKAYKLLMVDTVKEMGVGLSEAKRFSDEVFNYEKRIAEVTPSTEDLRSLQNLYVVKTVKELDMPPSVILWTKFLQSYFPESAFPETEIGLLSETYFQLISNIIASTSDGVLINYYMWRFMHTFVPLSSSRFRLVANYYKQTFEGVSDLNLSYKDNWESCIDETVKYLGHAVGAVYVSHYFPKESEEELQLYLHKLAGSLSSLTSKIPWLQEDHNSALSKVRSLFLLSGHPGFVKNNTLNTYYKDLRVSIDFLKNIQSGVYFLHKKQEEMLKSSAIPDNSWTVYSHDVTSDYKYAGNQLVVPAGLFETPLFDSKSPLAVKYGVLAAHVANKLAESFDDKGINYDEFGARRTWLSNDSLSSFAIKKKCLKSIISSSFVNGVQANSDLTIGSVIADIGGVKIAYEAYKRHAQEEGESAELPIVGVSNNQAFFISYAQSLCQAVRPQKLQSSMDSNTNLPEELRILTTLQQLPEFSAAFSCSRDTSMNAREHCRMW